jgi:hypothetical protein
MKALGRKACLAVLLGCAAFLAIPAAAPASGTEQGDGRVIMGASVPEDVPEEIADKADDGPDDPAGALGDERPDGDNGEPGADPDKRAHCGPGPLSARKSPSGENGAPGAEGESGHARAPPAARSTHRTGSGA